MEEILEILKGQDEINQKFVHDIQENKNLTEKMAEYCQRLMDHDAFKSKLLSDLVNEVETLKGRIRVLEEQTRSH